MTQYRKSSDKDKIDILENAAKYDKDLLDDLCKEFDALNPKSHKSKFAE